jgi:hypothetical protein
MTPVCRCCGQTLPPEIPGLVLSTHQQRIFAIVRRAGRWGVTSDALFERLYADDPEGGPLSGRRSMHVIVQNLNIKLRAHGKRIRCPPRGRGVPGVYVLEDVC